MSALSLNLTDLLHNARTFARKSMSQGGKGLQGISPEQLRKTLMLLPGLMLKPEIGGLLLVLFILIFPVGMDMVLKPLWEKQKILDSQLDDQRKRIAEKQAEVKQFKAWQQQLAGLDTDLQTVEPGQSAKVLAVSQSAHLIALARGEGRDPALGPELPAPYNKRTFISLTPGAVSVVNIIKQETPAPAPATPPPAASATDAKPDQAQIAAATKAAADKAEADKKAAENNKLNVWRFNYELKVQGTYPALADMLNQWVNSKQLVVLRAISLAPVTGANIYASKSMGLLGDKAANALPVGLITPMDVASLNEQQKNASKNGATDALKPLSKNQNASTIGDSPLRALPNDPQVPLEMSVSFSLYLYDPTIQAQVPDALPAT